jgi:hypothetical protein
MLEVRVLKGKCRAGAGYKSREYGRLVGAVWARSEVRVANGVNSCQIRSLFCDMKATEQDRLRRPCTVPSDRRGRGESSVSMLPTSLSDTHRRRIRAGGINLHDR